MCSRSGLRRYVYGDMRTGAGDDYFHTQHTPSLATPRHTQMGSSLYRSDIRGRFIIAPIITVYLSRCQAALQ